MTPYFLSIKKTVTGSQHATNYRCCQSHAVALECFAVGSQGKVVGFLKSFQDSCSVHLVITDTDLQLALYVVEIWVVGAGRPFTGLYLD